ncbi:MAG: NusG domain II-containing protein [Lachnospiraceae bacterium]|nr:NusG domain II-containing protein [Lachnospiraceae bacterium]
MKIAKKTDIALFILAAAVALICFLFLRHTQSASETAETQYYAVIEVAGEEVARLPLSENTTYSIDQEGMHNVVVIEDGSVYMSEADCPNQNCVRQGKITQVGVPIACLPHQVIVMIVSGQ